MASENELRLHCCCFTGHRPEKLNMPEQLVVAALEREILTAVEAGFVTFISGMARGVDIWAAEQVLRIRQNNSAIHLICALPHPDFEMRWSREWQKRYRVIIEAADFVKVVCPSFSMGSYQARNEWMIDHSARLIAVYNGEAGGTRNTIEYAERQGIQIIRIEDV